MLPKEAVHSQYWTDLLANLNGISWAEIISMLVHKNHGFSNYEKCKKRNHAQIRQDVLKDGVVRFFQAEKPENPKIVEKILDEMCHLLDTQANPTRKLKWTGAFFIKCITRIYSSIYVNTQLLPLAGQFSGDTGTELFRIQFLKLSSTMPIVILPTHRSYMDFLFITYVMFINELPLPVVAAGDNFKALGGILTNYLKATGAFLIRRNANNKSDIEATDYYDLLRAYVHSLVEGGENPVEFFMEGTRTRSGQVLKPKTGLLSMIVDLYLRRRVEDICILPVTINYQRPIEEQLYINEITPQISKSKPKETAKNLLTAFDKIVKRKYGKVYVRFLEPFRLSDFHEQWRRAALDDSDQVHDLPNCLASRVCLAQAYSNVLMPFNLITFSILARVFLVDGNTRGIPKSTGGTEPVAIQVPVKDILADFLALEDLLSIVRSDFVAGWKGHLDIIDELKLDRDAIIRASSDRKSVEFEFEARTFHTFSYYSNQVMQILIPIAISSLLIHSDDKITGDNFKQYKKIRSIFSGEFLMDKLSLEDEFKESSEIIRGGKLCEISCSIILKHLKYISESYLIFLRYLEDQTKKLCVLDKSEFFERTIRENDCHFISKDMLNNMINLAKEFHICDDHPIRLAEAMSSKRREEKFYIKSDDQLFILKYQFSWVQSLISQRLALE